MPAFPLTTDHRIPVPGGDVFAREWAVPDALPKPPLILLHDSLGSAKLWRDFDPSHAYGARIEEIRTKSQSCDAAALPLPSVIASVAPNH
jgi:hypothetical protein